MEPVNIDFMLGGNVGTEGTKIESKLNDITNASKNSVDAVAKTGQAAVESVKANIEKTKETIKNLESMLVGLKSKVEEAAPGNAKQDAILNLNEANRSLNAQKTILSGLQQQKTDLINTQKQQVEANNKEEGSVVSMVTTLYKWATGLFIVKEGLEIGKKIMESTEGTAHTLEIAIEGVTAGTRYFFKTIASGDWSNFLDGLEKAVKGAKEYVDAVEWLENRHNEQKIKSSSLDIKIGEARADSYSTDPAVVKKALQTLVALQTEKLTGESKIAKDTYELRKKKIADDNGWNEKELENTIKYYSKNREIIEAGEKYNALTAKKSTSISPSGGGWGAAIAATSGNSTTAGEDEELKKLISDAKREGINLQKAGELALKFSKVTFPERNEVADLLAKAQDAEASINISNRRDKQRLVGILKKEEDDTASAAKKAQEEKNKAIKAGLDYETEIGRKRIANKFEIEQQLLNAQEDGTAKELQQADLDYRKKLSDLEIKKADFIKKQNEISGGIDKETGKKTKKYSSVIPEADQKQFDALADAALKVKEAKDKKIEEKEKKHYDELLLLAARYTDELTKIEEEYNARIQKLAQAGYIVQAAYVAQERDEKLSAVSTKLLKETDLYKLASGKQLQISKELTSAMIAELEKRIQASETINSEDADRMLAKLHQADYTVNKTDNPFADLIDGVEKYRAAREEQSRTNTQDDLEGFVLLEDAANKAQKATLEAAAGALQGIGSVIQEVVSSLDQLGVLSESDKKMANEVIGMVSGAASIAQGLATGNPIAVITGAVQLLTNAFQLFDVESKKIADRIAADQAALDKLTAAYQRLEVAMKSVYSTEKASLLLQEKANLEYRIANKKDQLEAEQQKQVDKNNASNGKGMLGWLFYLLTPGTDDNKVTQLNKDITDLGDQIAENKDKLIEALTGTSVSSAIDEFANAYADAFTTGEDAAAKSMDVVSNLFKTALVEKLKEDLKPGVTDLMTMVSDAMADGILTADEKAAIALKKKELDAKATQDQQAFTDLGLNTSSTAKGIQGDVKNMTEDTGSALVGQIIAMRLNVAEIVSGYKNSAAMMSQSIAIQQRIADNTEFCRKLERMDATMEYWRVNGLKIV